MNGHIRQRSQGSWEISYDLPLGADGKRKQKFETVKGTKRDAQRALRERLTAIENGSFTPKRKETVGEFMVSWLEGYASTHTSPRTVQGYRGNIQRYITPCLGGVPVQSLTARHIQQFHKWMLDKGLSAQTVTHAHRVLSEALKHAAQWGMIPRNPCEAVSPPRPQRGGVQVPETDAIRRFLDAASNHPLCDVFKLALYTGLRRSELAGLRWEGIDFTTSALRVTGSLQRITGKGLVAGQPKTRTSRRAVALGQTAIELLRSVQGKQLVWQAELGDLYQNPAGYVFTNELGQPVDSDRLSKEFAKLARIAGLPKGVSLHTLRHLHASLLLAEGVNIKIIQERLGHSNVSLTLNIYSHLLPGLQEQAAQILDKRLAQG